MEEENQYQQPQPQSQPQPQPQPVNVQINQVQVQDEGSTGLGVVLGVFLGIIGVIIALVINKPKTTKGALIGFGVELGVSVLITVCTVFFTFGLPLIIAALGAASVA